ncbi:MAG: hypothetical protein O2931_08725 [Planctomycetota bacterium]|nr:hypothetical protein [Planctomycetota bacterium]MDA1178865.1 hypothetical protein [Planctomycetota bacterium]
MSTLQPIYRRNNCCFCAPLQWGLSVFWRMPMCDDTWINELRASTENDGIRILGHQFAGPATSQFAVSTTPHVSPRQVVQKIKGRLQNLLKRSRPRSWRRNFAIRSVGHASRTMIERYVASQVDHHYGNNQRLKEQLHEFQVENAEIDLSILSSTAHANTGTIFISCWFTENATKSVNFNFWAEYVPWCLVPLEPRATYCRGREFSSITFI